MLLKSRYSDVAPLMANSIGEAGDKEDKGWNLQTVLLLQLFESGVQKINAILYVHFRRTWDEQGPWCFDLTKDACWLASSLAGRSFLSGHRLVGLVVKASASRAEGPGFESRLRRDFFEVELYQ